MIKKAIIFLTLLTILITLSSCGFLNISSKWKDKEITIDGNDADWKNAMQNYYKFNLGCYNDA